MFAETRREDGQRSVCQCDHEIGLDVTGNDIRAYIVKEPLYFSIDVYSLQLLGNFEYFIIFSSSFQG